MTEETTTVLEGGSEIEWPVQFTLTVTSKQGHRTDIRVQSTDEIAALAGLQQVGDIKYVTQIAQMFLGDEADDYFDDGDED